MEKPKKQLSTVTNQPTDPDVNISDRTRKALVQREVRDMARLLLTDPIYLENLSLRIRVGEAAPAVETMLWHYAYGKPKETVEVQAPAFEDQSIEQLRARAIELAQLASRVIEDDPDGSVH